MFIQNFLFKIKSYKFSKFGRNVWACIIHNRFLRSALQDWRARASYGRFENEFPLSYFPREIGPSAYSPQARTFFLQQHSVFRVGSPFRLARYCAGNRSSRVTRKRNISDIHRHCIAWAFRNRISVSLPLFSLLFFLSVIQKFDVHLRVFSLSFSLFDIIAVSRGSRMYLWYTDQHAIRARSWIHRTVDNSPMDYGRSTMFFHLSERNCIPARGSIKNISLFFSGAASERANIRGLL